MKKNILFFAAAMTVLTACEEIPPTVTGSMGQGGGGGGNVDDQERIVLVEEFTGVSCVNCPAGSAFIEDLLAATPGRLVAVSIHAGEFSDPYPNSQYDFRTPDGNAILSYLGEPFGYPTAVVNRRLFAGQFDLQLGQGDWAGYIAEEMAIPPKVRIDLQPEYDPVTRDLTATVTLYVDEDITAPDVRLSLIVTESGVKDLQLTPASTTPVADYTHKHIFRDAITAYDGDPISEPMTAGAEIEKTFNYTLSNDWDASHCKLIAFVNISGGSKDVLQAYEVEIE